MWWDWNLLGLWIVINGVAYVVIPVAGALLQQWASSATSDLVHNRTTAIVIVGVVGGVLQGIVLGRWQWRLVRRRVPELDRRGWVLGTLMPAVAVWLLVLAPWAVDAVAGGEDTLQVFRNGFVQALVLGPLIGLGQATALRPVTSRWAWWLVANVTAYLSGALLHQLAMSLRDDTSLPAWIAPYFPALAFTIHGIWMLWVTAPQAIVGAATALPPRNPRA